MKILLVHPRKTEPPQHPPYILLQEAAIADNKGHKVAVLDNNVLRLQPEALTQEIKDDTWDIINIWGLPNQFRDIVEIAKTARQEHPNALITGDGPWITAMPFEMMKWIPEMDIGIIGESYNTLRDIFSHTVDRNWSKIRGLVYREGQKIKLSSMRPLISEKNLDDEIPWPAYEFSELEAYLLYYSQLPYAAEFSVPMGENTTRRLDVYASYGCTGSCHFCSQYGLTPSCQTKIYGRKVAGKEQRYHSPEYVVNLITHLRLLYKINCVCFMDANLAADRPWMFELFDALQSSGLATLVYWGMATHVATIDSALLDRAKQVGCRFVSFGMETTSQKLLNDINKGQTKEQISSAWHATRNASLNPVISYLIGHPKTTIDDLIEDAEFLQANQIHVHPLFLQPYPGTKLFDQYRDKIINQYLTLEERKALAVADPVKVSLIRENALKRWLLELEDNTKFSVNLTDFTDAELLGLRYLVGTEGRGWDIDRLKKYKALKTTCLKKSLVNNPKRQPECENHV